MSSNQYKVLVLGLNNIGVSIALSLDEGRYSYFCFDENSKILNLFANGVYPLTDSDLKQRVLLSKIKLPLVNSFTLDYDAFICTNPSSLYIVFDHLQKFSHTKKIIFICFDIKKEVYEEIKNVNVQLVIFVIVKASRHQECFLLGVDDFMNQYEVTLFLNDLNKYEFAFYKDIDLVEADMYAGKLREYENILRKDIVLNHPRCTDEVDEIWSLIKKIK